MNLSSEFKTATISGILPDSRLLILVLALFFSVFPGCKKPAKPLRASEVFLRTVGAADSDGLDSLRNQVAEIVLLPEDLPDLYPVLRQSKPDDNLGEKSIRYQLFQRLAGIQNAETTRFIEEIFSSLEGKTPLQAAALSVLAQGKSDESLHILMRILRQETPELGSYQGMVLGQLFETPEKIPLIAEELFQLAIESPYELQSLELISAGLVSGQIKPADLTLSLPPLLNKFPAAEPSQKIALLQCFAFFPSDTTVIRLLETTLDDPEPEVRLAAAMAGLKGGFPVPETIWEALAADFRTRNQLFIDLSQSGHIVLFPPQYFNQQAFAEGDLAAWLIARGNQPETFRLLGKSRIETGAESGNVFVFEFKEKGQWLTGISGPQPLDSTDVLETGYLTTSKFEKAGKRKIEEIAEDLIE